MDLTRVLPAAAVASVGENDEGFAARLFAHELIGGEEEGVVENGAASTAGTAGSAAVIGGAGVFAGGVDLLEGGLKQRAGRGEVLQELRLGGELHDEGSVLRRGEHLVKEDTAGAAFLVDDFALRETCVDQQTQGQGKIGVLVEVANGLGLIVDLKNEIVLGKILDEGSLLVAHDDGEVDEAGVDGDGGGGGGWGLVGRGSLLLREEARRKQNAGQKDRPERAENDHVELDDIGWAGFQWGVLFASHSVRQEMEL